MRKEVGGGALKERNQRGGPQMDREGHARECSPAPLTSKLGSFKERQPPPPQFPPVSFMRVEPYGIFRMILFI